MLRVIFMLFNIICIQEVFYSRNFNLIFLIHFYINFMSISNAMWYYTISFLQWCKPLWQHRDHLLCTCSITKQFFEHHLCARSGRTTGTHQNRDIQDQGHTKKDWLQVPNLLLKPRPCLISMLTIWHGSNESWQIITDLAELLEEPERYYLLNIYCSLWHHWIFVFHKIQSAQQKPMSWYGPRLHYVGSVNNSSYFAWTNSRKKISCQNEAFI